jgi:hypothetical protein
LFEGSVCAQLRQNRPNFVERRKAEVQAEMHGLPKIHLHKE